MLALGACGVDESGPSWAERQAASANAGAAQGGGDAAGASVDEATASHPDGDAATSTDDATLDVPLAAEVPDDATATADEPAGVSSVLVIGDSLTESAEQQITAELEALGLDVVVDAAASRRLVDDRGIEPGIAALRNALAFRSPDMFVVALGTNDVGEKPPEEIMADVAQIVAMIPTDAPLVWVDTWVHAEQRASHYANLAIRQALAGRPGTTIVDWWSHGYDEGVIAGDGIHLQEAGKALFAELIAAAVEPLAAG